MIVLRPGHSALEQKVQKTAVSEEPKLVVGDSTAHQGMVFQRLILIPIPLKTLLQHLMYMLSCTLIFRQKPRPHPSRCSRRLLHCCRP